MLPSFQKESLIHRYQASISRHPRRLWFFETLVDLTACEWFPSTIPVSSDTKRVDRDTLPAFARYVLCVGLPVYVATRIFAVKLPLRLILVSYWRLRGVKTASMLERDIRIGSTKSSSSTVSDSMARCLRVSFCISSAIIDPVSLEYRACRNLSKYTDIPRSKFIFFTHHRPHITVLLQHVIQVFIFIL